ncbi:hypothetical protein CANARDRAFT_28650 [[Candida] arabinofermentans NRRL YB-2248]|uniref:RRM domain-containing protein n=1 Tax=[Candida] arabinofermentans NRRL YB-2248 TaxID=983967 RepID=A0A1E4SZI6_9ASCO|nr:hypothetical protein CANARDRAFT_28650 [[Candida] arabinofermentans NRRL YB-2248]
MSALEQSLDAIIASSKKTAPKKPAQKKAPVKVAKAKKVVSRPSVAAAVAKRGLKGRPTRPSSLSAAVTTAKRPSTALDYASKVVVHGLPKDIKNASVKEFFQSQIGNVKSVSLSYNEHGKSQGIATVIFNDPKAAQKAVLKFNNAPIDQGKSQLKLELIVDPTQRPLADRITPNALPNQPKPKARSSLAAKQVRQRVQESQKPKPSPSGRGQIGVERKSGAARPAKKAPKPRQKKKSLEELDQEMADYFNSNDGK